METTAFHDCYDVGARPRVVVLKGRKAVDARTRDSACTVVELRGELDAAALNQLVETFDDAITRDESDVVVDLAEVDFIGAGWIGTLVRSRARLEAQNRELVLRSPPQVIHRLLELCGLAYLIEPASHSTRRACEFNTTSV